MTHVFGYGSSAIPCINPDKCNKAKLSYECKQGEPLNLTVAKNCVQFYFECGQYDRDMESIVDKTIAHLEKIPVTDNATIFWDLDDTLFRAYYCDEKDISFGYIPELWHEWVMRGDAKVIPQARRLYNYTKARGFKHIIISGRKAHEYDITVENLKKEGISFDKLIVRKPSEEKITATEFKCRYRNAIIENEDIGWTATIGDQWSDHNGGATDFKVKFPNPGYIID